MDKYNFAELAKERRACRDFNGKPIEKTVLSEVVATALLAPSARNSQPWRTVCVTSDEGKASVKACLQREGKNVFLDKAAAYVALVEIGADLKAGVTEKLRGDFFVKYDVGELAAYLTLAAKSRGIDTCIIGWVDRPALREVLNLKESEECSLVIALGYSDAPLCDKNRKGIEEKLTFL